MTVKDIVREKLIQLGADGLVWPDMECGCGIDDLAPCGHDCLECVPAKKAGQDEDGVTLYEPMKELK